MRSFLSAFCIACMAIFLVAGHPVAAQEAKVTGVMVKKSERVLYLLHGNKILKKYKIDLGFNPKGHKRQRGDGRTPEGAYRITHRNPQSAFHLSLGISYPSAQDRAAAAGAGVNPGGDIFIHGRGPKQKMAGKDWTAGCLAVTDEEMNEIYASVAPGTPIWIKP